MDPEKERKLAEFVAKLQAAKLNDAMAEKLQALVDVSAEGTAAHDHHHHGGEHHDDDVVIETETAPED